MKKQPLFHMVLRDTFYSNVDPRRRQELADSRMIREDHGAMANLPTEAINRQFSTHKFNQSPWFDDEVGGY